MLIEDVDAGELSELEASYVLGESVPHPLRGAAVWLREYVLPPLGRAELEIRWSRLVAAQPILRTVINEQLRRVVLPEVPAFPWRLEEIGEMGDDARLSELRRDLLEKRSTSDWPQWRLCLVNSAHQSRLLVACPTAICSADYGERIVHLLENPSVNDGRSLRTGRAAAHGAELAVSESYWMERLATFPPAPELPRRGGGGSSEVRRLAATLDVARWQSLCSIAASHGIDHVGAACLAFAKVLSVWAASSHFVLQLRDTEASWREEGARWVEQSLLLEIQLAGGCLLDEGIALQRRLAADRAHTGVSSVRLLRELGRRLRSPAGTALAPVVFSSSAPERGDGVWRCVYHFEQLPQALVHCHVRQNAGGGLEVNWFVRDGQLAPDVAKSMFGAYIELLERMSSTVGCWTEATLDVVPRAQLETRARRNATELELASARPLYSGLFDHALRAPESTAIVSEAGSHSYAELARWARCVAGELERVGVCRGSLVGVLLPKGVLQVVATIGIMLRGAAYVPLSCENPPSRNRALVEHCGLTVVLCDDEARVTAQPELWQLAKPTLVPPAPTSAAILADTEDVAAPDDLAYVIFTSGSTGVPKGVAITHRQAMNTLLAVNRRFGVGPEDRVLGVSELNFDLSVYDIFGMFLAGGALVLPQAALVKNPIHLARLMADQRVTLWNSVPAFFEMLLDFVTRKAPSALASLRSVFLSGDWVSISLLERLRIVNDSVALVAMGGATEASVWSNYFEVEVVDPDWASIPYGQPLPNQTFAVLNADLQPAPDWVAGELFIGGAGVAVGYYGDALLTTERFIVHPRTRERLYRTGDFGRYWSDGTLEFLGRRDTQVKIHGHRIELGDIEANLTRHPHVRDAAVVPVGTRDRRQIAAFVVLKEEAQASPADLREHLRRCLPEYMVPQHVRFLGQLPLTANGKVNRGALEATPLGAETPPARSPARGAEPQVLAAWQAVLCRTDIDPSSEFFQLGGSSLDALKLCLELQRRTGIQVPLSLPYEQRSLAAQAAAVEHRLNKAWSPLVPLANSVPDGQSLFCVHPVGGGAVSYWGLAAHWAYGPVWGVQSRASATNLPGHTSIEAMACDYTAHIERVCPRGPVHLLGWSMGGSVALHIAQRLASAGRVARVVMLDPLIARDGSPRLEGELLAFFVRDLCGGDADVAASVVRSAVDPDPVLAAFSALRARGLIAPKASLESFRRMHGAFVANSRCLRSSKPFESRVPVLLVEAAQRSPERFPDLVPLYDSPAWRKALPGLFRSMVDVDHYAIIREGALRLWLGAALDFWRGADARPLTADRGGISDCR